MKDYKKILNKEFNIPYVSIDYLDGEILDNMIKYMYDIYNKYPLLHNSICAFGPTSYINDHINLLINSTKRDNIKYEDHMSKYKLLVSIKLNYSYIRRPFLAFSYGEDIYNASLTEIEDFLEATEVSKYGLKYAMYHEFGHIITYNLNLTNDIYLNYAIKKLSYNYEGLYNNLSPYSERIYYEEHDNKGYFTNEIIADAFAIYHISTNKYELTPLVRFIGEYIDNKYNKSYNSKKFNNNVKLLRKKS